MRGSRETIAARWSIRAEVRTELVESNLGQSPRKVVREAIYFLDAVTVHRILKSAMLQAGTLADLNLLRVCEVVRNHQRDIDGGLEQSVTSEGGLSC